MTEHSGAERACVQFVAPYHSKSGALFTTGERATFTGAELADLLTRPHVAALVPSLPTQSPEDKAMLQAPAHRMIDSAYHKDGRRRK